jgi:hypothetical protein
MAKNPQEGTRKESAWKAFWHGGCIGRARSLDLEGQWSEAVWEQVVREKAG